MTHIELGAFLADMPSGPQHQALLRLIGALVEIPPFADETESGAPTGRIG
ncbi:MAG: hypothetical protein JWQ36_2432 [Enterovirga sp.]|jgi:hypothetical protein|nr:hypothetical protein [Enterovirga sp.]